MYPIKHIQYQKSIGEALWLRFCTSTSGGPGLTPGWGTDTWKKKKKSSIVCPPGKWAPSHFTPQERLTGWLPGPTWDAFTLMNSMGPRVRPSALQHQNSVLAETLSWSASRCWLMPTHRRLINNQNAHLLIYSGEHLACSVPLLPIDQLQGKRKYQKVAQWARNFDKGNNIRLCSFGFVILKGIHSPESLMFLTPWQAPNSRILLTWVRTCQAFPLLDQPSSDLHIVIYIWWSFSDLLQWFPEPVC